MRDDGSTPSKFYNQEGNIVMADNQSGDFDISVENHEGSRLERRLASFDDKYNIFVSNKRFTSYLGSEALRSFKITDYIHPDDVESFKKFVEDKSFTGGEEVFRLKKKNNEWRYNIMRIHTEKGMIENSVGDIESLPYLESIRQLKWELGKDALCVHLTYVPYLAAAGELKTKPTQHSVKELQSAGIQPDVLVLRTEHELSNTLRKKVALFCNVDEKAVVQSIDAPTIYEVPILMQAQGLDETILKKMGLPVGDTPGLGPWRAFLERRHKAETTEPVHIALVGKYDLQDAYKSIREALSQAGTYNDRKVSVDFVNSEKLTDENVAEALKGTSSASSTFSTLTP